MLQLVLTASGRKVQLQLEIYFASVRIAFMRKNKWNFGVGGDSCYLLDQKAKYCDFNQSIVLQLHGQVETDLKLFFFFFFTTTCYIMKSSKIALELCTVGVLLEASLPKGLFSVSWDNWEVSGRCPRESFYKTPVVMKFLTVTSMGRYGKPYFI